MKNILWVVILCLLYTTDSKADTKRCAKEGFTSKEDYIKNYDFKNHSTTNMEKYLKLKSPTCPTGWVETKNYPELQIFYLKIWKNKDKYLAQQTSLNSKKSNDQNNKSNNSLLLDAKDFFKNDLEFCMAKVYNEEESHSLSAKVCSGAGKGVKQCMKKVYSEEEDWVYSAKVCTGN
tara:strand:- start:876 stop:1403 length:528 start_codon:yes stop_codon:yes gene_type:complete